MANEFDEFDDDVDDESCPECGASFSDEHAIDCSRFGDDDDDDDDDDFVEDEPDEL